MGYVSQALEDAESERNGCIYAIWKLREAMIVLRGIAPEVLPTSNDQVTPLVSQLVSLQANYTSEITKSAASR